MNEPLIEIRNLQTHFHTDEGVVRAVEDVSVDIPQGKTLGLVGESGSGKSVTALSVIRLVSPPGRIAGGRILMHAGGDKPIDLATLTDRQMRKYRGGRIGMIFQEPMTSLNPVFTAGAQIVEAIRIHEDFSKAEAWQRAVEMLRLVNIPVPEQRANEYPHQFSGGMRQRVMIAMALACTPDLLIADEPTTALDVTIQAQILDLLRNIQKEHNMSILMITHDLGVIAETADEVAVMYASKIVERAPVKKLFGAPRHPYTHGLFNSRPRPGQPSGQPLTTIEGMVPTPLQFPSGCKFHPRCPHAKDRCRSEEPQLRDVGNETFAACHLVDEITWKKS